MKRQREAGPTPESEMNPSEVRERTLSHLEKLMRTTTTVGAGIVLACSARAEQQRPPQVCDPLPPPIGCCEDPDQFLLRGCLDHQTRWVKLARRWILELSLWAVARPEPMLISFGEVKKEEIKIRGASIKDMRKEPRRIGFMLAPVTGRKQVDMEFGVRCDTKWIHLKLTLDLSKPPQANRSVPVKPFN